jgi:hypothetical protein
MQNQRYLAILSVDELGNLDCNNNNVKFVLARPLNGYPLVGPGLMTCGPAASQKTNKQACAGQQEQKKYFLRKNFKKFGPYRKKLMFKTAIRSSLALLDQKILTFSGFSGKNSRNFKITN